MSHVVANTDFVITDLDALAEAAGVCGLEVRLNQTTWKWYGRWVKDYHQDDAAYKHGIKPEDYGKGLHAIGLKGDTTSYEIGLVKNPNGEGFVPVYDFYGSGHQIIDACGKGLEKLRMAYTEVVTLKKMTARLPGVKPWRVTKTIQPNGEVLVEAVR